MRIKPIYIVILLLAFISLAGRAQTKVHVLTKHVSKEFDYAYELLTINAEKANIDIKTWNESKIKVEIRLISKNYNKNAASRDLGIMKYSVTSKPNEIKLTNYFEAAHDGRISSNLSVEYLVFVPVSCNMHVVNIYGDIHLTNTRIQGKIKNSFGAVFINNCTNNLNLELDYADLNIKGTMGNYVLQARQSNLTLNKISGKYRVNMTYGKLNIISPTEKYTVEIEAQRAETALTLSDLEKCSLFLTAKRDKIEVPAEYVSLVKKESGTTTFEKKAGTANKITINTSYCPITLTNK